MTEATFVTSEGSFTVRLMPEHAPKTVANFVDLAKKGYYDDVIFHRVIPGFVIQAGDGQHGKKASLNAGRVGTGGPGYQFEDEKVQGEYVRGDITTNTIEGAFSIFKRGMRGVYQFCAEKHLHRYLTEFEFRYSSREANGYNDTARADRLLKGIVGKRLTYQTTSARA